MSEETKVPGARSDRPRITIEEPTRKEAEQRVRDTASRHLDILEVRSADPKNPDYVRRADPKRDKLPSGTFIVGGDRVGRWVNTKAENFERKKALGYEVCNDPLVRTMSEAPSGPQKINELVFMTCRRDDFEARKKEDMRIADERRKGPKREFERDMARAGVPTYDTSRR